jgi:hypothetical protein
MTLQRKQGLVLLGLVALGIAFRVWLLQLPSYRYVFYDEAIPGLMAMDILDGNWPLVYWAHPYLGSLDAIAAAGFFAVLGPSTLALRLSVLLFFALFAVCQFKLAQEATGRRFPWYLALYLCIPPLGLNEFSLSTIGGYIHTVAIGSLMLLLTARLLRSTSNPEARWLFIGLGFFSGLGFWTFLMIAPFVAACYGTLFLKFRLKLFRIPLLLSGTAFFIGSLPLWAWNLTHDFLGFKTRTAAATPGQLADHGLNFFALLYSILGRTEEYATSMMYAPVTWAVSAALIILLLFWLRFHARGFFAAVFRRSSDPGIVDLCVICFVICALAYILSNKGQLVLVRYGMPLYATLPVLLTVCFHRIAHGRRWLHLLLVPLLLLMNAPYNIAYSRQNILSPAGDDIIDLIDFCRRENIRYAYGHYTVAHPVTFESRRQVLASDFGGFRNSDFLKAVDRSDRAAIITDHTIPVPHPDAMASQLDLVTNGYRRQRIGKYEIFFDFDVNECALTDVTARIQSIAFTPEHHTASLALDRNISTYWHSAKAQSPEDGLIITLDSPRPITRISLLPGFPLGDFPRSLEAAVSQDGRDWRVVKSADDIVEAFLPFGKTIRLFGNGQLDIALPGEAVRHIRLRPTRPDPATWTVAELFVFENAGPALDVNPYDFKMIANRHPDAFLHATPWLGTHLEAEEGVPGRILSLYPEDLIYHEVYRRWDFSGRQVDFRRPNLFVGSPEGVSALIQFLRREGIASRVDHAGPLAAVRTEAHPVLDLTVEPVDPSDGHFSADPHAATALPAADAAAVAEWHGYRGVNATGGALQGVGLSLPDLRWAMAEVAVFISDDGQNWQPLQLIRLHNAYWADGVLLGINTPQLRWYFKRPADARHLLAFVKPRATDAASALDLKLLRIADAASEGR